MGKTAFPLKAALATAMIFSSALAFALPAPLQVRPGKVMPPIQSGISVGGKSADEFSLLSVRAENTPDGKNERLVLAYGDRFGQPHRGEPGYFHVALDRDARRLVIDLAQVRKTKIDPQQLSKILKNSKFVASSEMTMDPQDGSTNITLTMKQSVQVKVATVDADQGSLVLEILPSRGDRK